MCLILFIAGVGAFFVAASAPAVVVQFGFAIIGLLMVLTAISFASDVYLGDA
jgi:hypothetical protein